MSIPVTRPPLKPGEGKTIFWTHEELVKLDSVLCYYLYDKNGDYREHRFRDEINRIGRMIAKINRHI